MKQKLRKLLILMALALPSVSNAVILVPVADSTISGQNDGKSEYLMAKGQGPLTFALKYSLAELPIGTVSTDIKAVYLTFYMQKYEGAPILNVTTNAIADWGE